MEEIKFPSRKTLFTIIFWFQVSLFIGQHKISFVLDGGINKVHCVLKDSNTYNTTNFTPTAHLGISYCYDFSKNSTIGIDAMYSYMSNKETFQSFSKNLYTADTLNINISYFVLPVYYGLRFKKFSFQFGPQFRFALYSKCYDNGYSAKAPIILTWKSEEHIIKTKGFEFGTQASFCYQLFQKFNFYLKGYYGITNILIDDIHKSSNNWQLLLGVKYNFYTSKLKA